MSIRIGIPPGTPRLVSYLSGVGRMPPATLMEKLVAEASRQTWLRVRLSLRAQVVNWGGKEHPWALLQDIIDSTFSLVDAPPNLKVLFHLPGKKVNYRFAQGDCFDVEVRHTCQNKKTNFFGKDSLPFVLY